MDDGVDRLLRLPHVLVTHAVRLASQLFELAQARLRRRELIVRREQRPHVDQLLDFGQAASKSGLVVAVAIQHKWRRLGLRRVAIGGCRSGGGTRACGGRNDAAAPGSDPDSQCTEHPDPRGRRCLL